MTEKSLKTPLAFACALLLASCGGGSVTVPNGPVRLAEMRADSRPYYWVGRSFEGLELTYAEPYAGRFANLSYGTCEVETGLLVEDACTVPLTVQNVRCADGRVNVALFSHGGGRSVRAAKALRPLNAAARRAGGPASRLTAASSASPRRSAQPRRRPERPRIALRSARSCDTAAVPTKAR